MHCSPAAWCAEACAIAAEARTAWMSATDSGYTTFAAVKVMHPFQLDIWTGPVLLAGTGALAGAPPERAHARDMGRWQVHNDLMWSAEVGARVTGCCVYARARADHVAANK